GYLGRRIAERALRQGRTVHGTTRGRAGELRALGVVPVVCDVTDPAGLTGLPRASTVVYCVGFDRSAGRPMREASVNGLTHLLAALPAGVRRFIYVSSTGVYSQTSGEEVDECSQAEPRDPSGVVALEAETAVLRERPDAVVLRFAGIYGP